MDKSLAAPLPAADSMLVLFCKQTSLNRLACVATLQACAVAAARTCCCHGAQSMLTLHVAGFRSLYQEVLPRT